MNRPQSNQAMPLTALAVALVLPSLFPCSVHGMYDPKHGRWLQRDPDPYVDGMNLYQYVKGRPTVYVDWWGRQASRPTPGSQPGSRPALPDYDEVVKKDRFGHKYIPWNQPDSDWQRMAEGLLDECPLKLVLPDTVEIALRYALRQTLRTNNEWGGAFSYLETNKHQHRVWGPLEFRGGSANSWLALPLYAELSEKWKGYGTFHTHTSNRDLPFSLGDVSGFLQGTSKDKNKIMLMRNCKCTRAMVRLKGTKEPRTIDYPEYYRHPETQKEEEKESERFDYSMITLAKKEGFCFYKSCDPNQQILAPATSTAASQGGP